MCHDPVKKEGGLDSKFDKAEKMEKMLLEEAALEASKKRPKGHSQQQLDKCFESDDPDIRSAAGMCMGNLCRHRLLANRGAQRHNRDECRALGNNPASACRICADTGKPDSYHWVEDCPRGGPRGPKRPKRR